jgi:hypothetical protein
MSSSDPFSDEPFSIHSTTPDQERSPDLRQVDSLVLSEGPRSRREIVHYAIYSRNTGEFKGHRIGFRTRHRQKGIWQNDPAKSFTLETDEDIRNTVRFILAACEGSIPRIGGSFLVLPAPSEADATGLQKVLNALSADSKANLTVQC